MGKKRDHKLQQWPEAGNIADLAMKGKTSLLEIVPGTRWQKGPPELSQSKENWPASRNFKQEIPEAELRRNIHG